MMMVLRFSEFFTFIRATVLEDAKYYCKSHRRIKNLPLDKLEYELLEAEMQVQLEGKGISKLQCLHDQLGERLTYLERNKHYGQG